MQLKYEKLVVALAVIFLGHGLHNLKNCCKTINSETTYMQFILISLAFALALLDFVNILLADTVM